MKFTTEEPVHEPIMQDRINAIREDWDLSKDEHTQLCYLEHRLTQRFPEEDVWVVDVKRILSEDETEDGFTTHEIIDLLFDN